MTTLKDLWRRGAPTDGARDWAPVAPAPSSRWLVAALGCAMAAAAVLWHGHRVARPVEHFELDLHVVGTPDDERTVIVFSSEATR